MVSSFYINPLIKIVYYVIAERKLASQEIFFLRGWGGSEAFPGQVSKLKTLPTSQKEKLLREEPNS